MSQLSNFLCLFHPGALGDSLLALKAVRVLKKRFSEHRIAWFGQKDLGKVLKSCQEVHCAYSFEDINLLTSEKSGLLKNDHFADVFRRCDRAIGWMEDTDGSWKRYFFSAGVENVIVRSPHDPTLHTRHMSDRYLEILKPWLAEEKRYFQLERDFSEEVPLVFPDTGPSASFNSYQGSLIILHPGSGSPYKCAPINALADLGNGLMATPGRRLCVVGGPADHEAVRYLQTAFRSFKTMILQDRDLVTISRFLKQAHLFIGHDSGLSHLAACLGIPSLLFFGPTDPFQWAPHGEHVIAMRNVCYCQNEVAMRQCRDKPCLSFSLDQAVKNAENLLSCYPISPFAGTSL